MLVVTRRIDESIQIGDDITVTILEINGNQARIGISAPSDVAVNREEVYVRKAMEQHKAELREAKAEPAISYRKSRSVIACETQKEG